MIHITRLDYIGKDGRTVHIANVDVWHVRAGIDTLMNYFAAVYNTTLRAAYGYGCSEVMCTYKDYTKQNPTPAEPVI